MERFLITLLPWILIGGLICHLAFKPGVVVILPLFLISVVLFLLDILPFRRYNLCKVTLHNNKLYINNQVIDEIRISAIRPKKTFPPHSCLMLEFHFDDGKCFTFLDRPRIFLYKPKNSINSKSLDIIFKTFPSLKTKNTSRKILEEDLIMSTHL